MCASGTDVILSLLTLCGSTASQILLKPVCNHVVSACYVGVTVCTPAGPMIARLILLLCSFDLPARAIVLNMKQWNGKHDCLYCESPGTTLHGDHLHRYWPKDDNAIARSHTSLMCNADEATRTRTSVNYTCTCNYMYVPVY